MTIPALLTSPPSPPSPTTRCTTSTDRVIDGSSVTSSVMGMSDGPPFAASASCPRVAHAGKHRHPTTGTPKCTSRATSPVEAPVTTTDMDDGRSDIGESTTTASHRAAS